MRRIVGPIAVCLLASACATQPEDRPQAPAAVPPPVSGALAGNAEPAASIASVTDPEVEPMRVTGSLGYRQRVPLPADAVVSLSLWEQTPAAGVSEPVYAETLALKGRQVPVPFEIEVETWQDIASTLVRLEARIADASGTLLWTNYDGTVFSKEGGLVDLGPVTLSPKPEAVVSMPQLAGKEWMVARLDGNALLQTTRATIRFGEDGRISGNASCNAFTGSFKLNAGMLTIAPLALTRKACVPQLMQQEQSIISVLQTVSHVQIDETGLLILQNDDGTMITARQGAS